MTLPTAVLGVLALEACTPGSASVDEATDGDSAAQESGAPADSAPPGDTGESGPPGDTGPDSAPDTSPPPDADGDGSPDAEDCDDTDPAVFPGGPDVCHDGVDTNCDGLDDTCDWAGEANVISYTADVMEFEPYHAEYGSGPCAGSDVDGDGVGDIVVGAGHSDPAQVRLYVVRGGPTFPASASDGAWASLSAPGDDSNYAEWVTCAGDLDGDGRDEFLVRAPGDEWGTLVVNSTVAGAQDRDAAAGIVVAGARTLWPGTSRGSADLDGDGHHDLALSYAAGDDGDRWGVALFAGPLAGDVALGDAVATVEPGTATCKLGSWNCEPAIDPSGDFDGDGLSDLAAGHLVAATGGKRAGAAWIFLGPLGGARTGDDAEVALMGAFDDHALGTRVAAGDLDGDGYDDLAVAADGATADGAYRAGGAVYVLGGGPSFPASLGDARAVIAGPSGSALGYYLASGRDLDGDGRDELAMFSSYVLLPESEGPEWIVFLAADPGGTVDVLDLPGRLYDPAAYFAGDRLNLADDVTGDGRPDLVLQTCWKQGGCYQPPAVIVARGGT